MRALHLTSFIGNIGDAANHMGFYHNFREHVTPRVDFVPCEIREFYRSWNLNRFDDAFIDYVNTFDLFVIGGGNFIEPYWDYSRTATSVDIPPELFRKITVPVFFNGLGFDDTRGITPENLEKFRAFFSCAVSSGNVMFSVRNDGSYQTLAQYVLAEELARVAVVPDGGFFYRLKDVGQGFFEGGGNIGICLACDMKDRRFGGGGEYPGFIRTMADFCVRMAQAYPEKRLIFVPHIYQDYEVITDVLAALPDPVRRRQVVVSHLDPTDPDVCFAAYAGCGLVVSLRFHGSVVPIANNIPTIGVTTLKKHGLVYHELGMPERAIDVQSEGLADKLEALAVASLEHGDAVAARYRSVNAGNSAVISAYYAQLKAWLGRACR